MRRLLRLVVLTTVLSAPLGTAHAAAAPDDVRAVARTFGALPRLTMPALSPDGAMLAALEPVDGRHAVVLRPRHALESARVLFKSKTAEVRWFDWVGTSRLIVAVSRPGKRGGAVTTETLLYAVSVEGGEPLLIPSPRKSKRPQIGTDVVIHPAGDPDHLLMSWDGDLDGTPSLYRVDLRDGSADEIERGTSSTTAWLADSNGQVRLRVEIENTTTTFAIRDTAVTPWRTVLQRDMLSGSSFIPRAFDPVHPNRLYVLSDHETGRNAAYAYDTASGAWGAPLFAHPEVDVEDIMLSPDGRNVSGVLYMTDLPEVRFFDEAARRRQAIIDSALPDSANITMGGTADGRFHLVVATGPREPGAYYVYDETTGGLEAMGRRYPTIDRATLANVVPYRYRARDGLEIPGYLTIPRGVNFPADNGARVPLVILPHGGPAARDAQTFDYLSQFIASLGYAVLRPNYRGSDGYGRHFRLLGERQWGRAMQDDIADGARALIADGFADPERLCIVGGSYGGYAALMGVVRDSALYRCAASINGVTDLALFIDNMRHYRFSDLRRARIVDPMGLDGVSAISPVANAEAIDAAVLIIQGGLDVLVPAEHGQRMARALSRAGKDVEFVLMREADHQLNREADRVLALERLGSFLRRNLGRIYLDGRAPKA